MLRYVIFPQEHWFVFVYTIDDVLLNRRTHIKYLGVIMDYKFYFYLHLNYICSQVYKTMDFILRNTREFQSNIKILYLLVQLM